MSSQAISGRKLFLLWHKGHRQQRIGPYKNIEAKHDLVAKNEDGSKNTNKSESMQSNYAKAKTLFRWLLQSLPEDDNAAVDAISTLTPEAVLQLYDKAFAIAAPFAYPEGIPALAIQRLYTFIVFLSKIHTLAR
jgi:hypothetical protein